VTTTHQENIDAMFQGDFYLLDDACFGGVGITQNGNTFPLFVLAMIQFL
jgi:hypothetical protein